MRAYVRKLTIAKLNRCGTRLNVHTVSVPDQAISIMIKYERRAAAKPRYYMNNQPSFRWKSESAPKLNVHIKNGVVWLSYPSLDREEWVINAFSTRLGGVSTGYQATMNLSFKQDCSPDAVRENFSRFADAVGFSTDDLILSDQTHTTNVLRVGRRDRGKGFNTAMDWHDVDGFITNEPGCALATFYADCVPLYFVDPVHRAIGLSHSGWKGTAKGMGKITAMAMAREFGTDPEDLICAIGPSICQDSYEVGEDVAAFFDKAFLKNSDTVPGKYYLDLWEANKAVLIEAGVREENITLPNLCTACNSDKLFSHRASKGKRGNLGAFLMIR